MLVFSTLYSYIWDIYMDWGLFEGGAKKMFLRSVTTYPSWVYYFAILSNALLRCSWVIVLMLPRTIDARLIAFLIALMEIFR